MKKKSLSKTASGALIGAGVGAVAGYLYLLPTLQACNPDCASKTEVECVDLCYWDGTSCQRSDLFCMIPVGPVVMIGAGAGAMIGGLLGYLLR